MQPIIDVRRISLISAQIPNTAFNVTQGRNTLFIESESHSVTRCVVTPGKWGLQDLLSEIHSQLLPAGSWNISYDSRTYQVKITHNETPFKLISYPGNMHDLLGFTYSTPLFATEQISNQAPRLNSNKMIGIDLGLPGCDLIEIPNLHRTSTFVVPFMSEFEAITFAGSQDLAEQTVKFQQDGIDLYKFDVKLLRTDCNDPLRLYSDISFLLEIESAE